MLAQCERLHLSFSVMMLKPLRASSAAARAAACWALSCNCLPLRSCCACSRKAASLSCCARCCRFFATTTCACIPTPHGGPLADSVHCLSVTAKVCLQLKVTSCCSCRSSRRIRCCASALLKRLKRSLSGQCDGLPVWGRIRKSCGCRWNIRLLTGCGCCLATDPSARRWRCAARCVWLCKAASVAASGWLPVAKGGSGL